MVARLEGVVVPVLEIRELDATAQPERAVAEQLDNLYTYINSRLLDVTMKHDIAACDEVHKLLSTLREGWAQAATQPPASELALAR